MNAVFPILKRDGSEYSTLSEFKQDLNKSTSGRYLLSSGHGWHGGVHLNTQSFPWGKGLRPIKAMLGGKVAAYRVNDDYQISDYDSTLLIEPKSLKYSNDFLLIEHEFENKEAPELAPLNEKTFKFYTLYMHLMPTNYLGDNSLYKTMFKTLPTGTTGKRGRVVREFINNDPSLKLKRKVTLSPGAIIEYLDAPEEITQIYTIKKVKYHLARFRIIELGPNATNDENRLLGKIVWMASGEKTKFEYLHDGSKMDVLNFLPMWMKDIELKKSQTVINPAGKPPLKGIYVEAGEDIGFMGLHQWSQDSVATIKEDYRVHIECFSDSEPPEFFLKNFGAKYVKSDYFTCIDGSNSSGEITSENGFFYTLANSVSGQCFDESIASNPRILKATLESLRKGFDTVIAKHPSEWNKDNVNNMYPKIHQLTQCLMDEHNSKSFSSDYYSNSKWRNEFFIENHNFFKKHEMERMKNLTWLQDADNLGISNELWHFWPFIFKLPKVTDEELRVRAFMRMLRVGEGTVGREGYETIFGGESFIEDYNKDWSDHPRIQIPFGETYSTAAGAYQIMGYVWDDPGLQKWKTRYDITDFSPINQDYFAIVLLKHKRHWVWPDLLKGDIKKALEKNKVGYAWEWASLPPGAYGQPNKSMEEVMEYYERYLNQERKGVSDLEIEYGFLEGKFK